MTRQLSPPTAMMMNITGVVPLAKGGTGGDNPDSAAASLGGVTVAAKGVAGGVATLDGSLKIPLSQMPVSSIRFVTIKGNTEVAVSQAATYLITNFDSKTTYSVSATAGTVAVSGNTLVFNAPSSPQDVTISINGRTLVVNVVPVRPARPVLVLGDFGIGASSALVITAKSFAMLAGGNTHQSTDWEVSLNGGFTNTVFSSYNDTVNKLAISTTALTAGTTYYVRARFRDSANALGSWSKTVSMKTRTVYKIDKLLAKTVAADRVSGDNFGASVAVSGDGKRMVVGAMQAASGATAAAGAAYVYTRSGQSWVFETKLAPADLIAGSRFGYTVALNFDGSRLAVATARQVPSNVEGFVYVFLRSNGAWVQETKLVPLNLAVGDAFGCSLSMSNDGSHLAVGTFGSDIGGRVNNGCVHIYKRSGITWSLEVQLAAADSVANDRFGASVALSSDATRIAVGAPGVTFGGVTASGAVYVFTRAGSTWTQEVKLVSAARQASDELGTSVSISADSSRVAAGAVGVQPAVSANSPFAIVFARTNSTWSQEVKLQASDRVTGDNLGSSISMNADGTRVIIAARTADVQGVVDAGSAYVFSRNLTSWTEDSKLSAADKSSSAFFGHSVCLSADASIAVIGALQDDPAGVTNAGSVYTFGT